MDEHYFECADTPSEQQQPCALFAWHLRASRSPAPQRDQADNAGERGERQHKPRCDGLGRRLVRSGPDPAHRREAHEDKNENRCSEAYRDHDG